MTIVQCEVNSKKGIKCKNSAIYFVNYVGDIYARCYCHFNYVDKDTLATKEEYLRYKAGCVFIQCMFNNGSFKCEKEALCFCDHEDEILAWCEDHSNGHDYDSSKEEYLISLVLDS